MFKNSKNFNTFLLIFILIFLIGYSIIPFFLESEIVVQIIFILTSIFILSKYLIEKYNFISFKNYSENLNNVIISQSQNILFYQGNLINGAKQLTKQVTHSIGCDRCSIWIFNEEKTSIKSQQIYIRKENKWLGDLIIKESDCPSYFQSLKLKSIVIASDAEKHPSTFCFSEIYLKPNGIKSMLDVPITFQNETIGVICIENFTKRKWKNIEINFAQMLSSLYSFAYSVRETSRQKKQIEDMDDFIDQSTLITKADKNGKITYVNKKFTEVSGWELEEVIGKNHNIVNSGVHPKEMWVEMYNTILREKKVWNKVLTNRAKDGGFYHVDSYIKAEFDAETGKHIGYISIRQDVTQIIETLKELDKKNTYLEHAAKIIRHDMHSGINTYIPRGITSLERRLKQSDIENLKLEVPIKIIKEGLKHTQRVYKGVYEFTNLVKKDSSLNVSKYNLKEILENYLSSTAYKSQVIINDLVEAEVNESLFCTAIDNLIRNGLKYNDSKTKFVTIRMEDDMLVVEDNGRGMSQEDFLTLSRPYSRKMDQKESGTGLGLNICKAILDEHGFTLSSEKLIPYGTKIKIKLKK